MTKRIGILTSGGDCAGLNATIRAVALRAHHGYGWTTIGIRYGTLGLLERPVEALTLDPDRLDAALARQGGTFLGSTNRGDPFAFPMEDRSLKDRSGEMVEGLASLDLDGLIGVGGDGSLDILRRLMARSPIAFIGIPKTIDNDVANTERAVGYSTAVAIAIDATIVRLVMVPAAMRLMGRWNWWVPSFLTPYHGKHRRSDSSAPRVSIPTNDESAQWVPSQ